MSNYIDSIKLTESAIKNGSARFERDQIPADFFPASCICKSKSAPSPSDGIIDIIINFLGESHLTNIRTIGNQFSPRCRFGAYFNKVNASIGGQLRILKKSHEEFDVQYLPPNCFE